MGCERFDSLRYVIGGDVSNEEDAAVEEDMLFATWNQKNTQFDRGTSQNGTVWRLGVHRHNIMEVCRDFLAPKYDLQHCLTFRYICSKCRETNISRDSAKSFLREHVLDMQVNYCCTMILPPFAIVYSTAATRILGVHLQWHYFQPAAEFSAVLGTEGLSRILSKLGETLFSI